MLTSANYLEAPFIRRFYLFSTLISIESIAEFVASEVFRFFGGREGGLSTSLAALDGLLKSATDVEEQAVFGV